jgi:hypothetical protein
MLKFILTLMLVLFTACSAFGGTYTIEWDANAEAVDGYNVYTSTTPGPPYERLTSPEGGLNVTTFTTADMVPGNHCFVVTAWLRDLESGYSNEVCGDMPLRIPGNIRLRIN